MFRRGPQAAMAQAETQVLYRLIFVQRRCMAIKMLLSNIKKGRTWQKPITETTERTDVFPDLWQPPTTLCSRTEEARRGILFHQ